MRLLAIISLLLSIIFTSSNAARIKDIATLDGIRDNQLVGYGLVVGLDGTGDKTSQLLYTEQTFRNMLLEFGIRLPPNKRLQSKNIAAVALSATLPPFASIGQKIDITISSLGDAKSLRGGTLLLAPLRGADKNVYAMAQGNVVVSGFGAQGRDGSKVTVNVTATGRIPNGATVEKTVHMPYIKNSYIKFLLNQPDFTTAERIARTINDEYGFHVAQPLSAGAVAVKLTKSVHKDNFMKGNSYVKFISGIENLTVRPGEVAAKVIVNSRSGTIVLGQDVTISPVAVSHGNLSVSVTENPQVSQPNAFSLGQTKRVNDSDVQINQQTSRAFLLKPGPTLKQLVDAINRVGAAPGDLVAILEAVKQAGALHGELEVI